MPQVSTPNSPSTATPATNRRKSWPRLALLALFAVTVSVLLWLGLKPRTTPPTPPPPSATQDEQSRRDPREALVDVSVTPKFRHRWGTMKVGARQHLDRKYTYDVIPPFMEGGLLFQGIHRPPEGTELTIKLERAAEVYFFFHETVDGGYGDIFRALPNWTPVSPAPQYDLRGGDHGKHMLAFRANLEPGTHTIPATTKARACFSLVFQFPESAATKLAPTP